MAEGRQGNEGGPEHMAAMRSGARRGKTHMRAMLKTSLLAFAILFLLPIGASGLRHAWGDAPTQWWAADRSSAGLLPRASESPQAMIRVFAAPTVSWRGIFASHSWLVLKDENGRYERYDYTAWGTPIRRDGFPPDGKWFGRAPDLVFAADGPAAAAAIPKLRQAIETYAWRNHGDYRAWPGPNSNTFVAAALAAAPELDARLPNTAIGRDYPHDGRWLTWTGRGLRLSLNGYAGLAAGLDGVELNILGAVAGLDFARPALLLPGLGRFGRAMAG